MLLLEKAWAKIYGSYENIDGGLTSSVLHDLTGAPCQVLETNDPSLWQQILQADKNDFVMTASCSTDANKQERFRQFGLVPEHAYSLISVHEIEVKGGVRERILELRNPWGKMNYYCFLSYFIGEKRIELIIILFYRGLG